jgi:hypothetical protein
MTKLLTAAMMQAYALPAAPHWVAGFLQARLVLARKICAHRCMSFFYALTFYGGRYIWEAQAWRSSTRSANPDILSTAQVFAGLFGGFKTLYWSLL